MKKIAFYIPDLQFGGAERMLVNLANYLASSGFHIDLILNERKGDYLGLVSKDVNIINLRVKRTVLAILPLSKYIKTNTPDRLISSLYHANLVAIISGLLTRSSHRTYIRQENVTKEIVKNNSIKSSIHMYLVRMLYRRCAGVIAISDGVRNDFVERRIIDTRKIRTIHNPAFEESILSLKEEPLENDIIGKDCRILINVGRLNIAKNHRLLINVFSQLRAERHENLKLVIVGDGELRNELDKQIKELGLSDSVLLVGAQKNPFKWLSKAELFVFSSQWEGFGNVLVEALACTKRVIATNCPSGPNEILDSGRYGYLVSNNSHEELLRMLHRYFNNELVFDNDETSYRRFSVDRIAKEYLDFVDL